MLVGPNISPHYISITLAKLHFKCNYICHNLSGFTTWQVNGMYFFFIYIYFDLLLLHVVVIIVAIRVEEYSFID